MTPSIVKVNPLSKEPTNRVIRENKDRFNYFCRLTMVKENHQEVFFEETEKGKHLNDHYLKRILTDGICALSTTKFIWLSHSNSSMKKKSFWFVTEEGGVLSREHIIKQLGNFKAGESESKRIAREAQNFSSSVPIITLSDDEIMRTHKDIESGY